MVVYGTDESCIAIYSEWIWKFHIGRYGGCFEEGIWWVYGTGESCAILERLAMMEG